MSADKRLNEVRTLLFEYTRSPSIQHIKDPYSIDVLAQRIMRAVDGRHTMWRRWTGPREQLLKAAATCWIPTEDLRDFLNEMPGPPLTNTDVAQRLRAYFEEDYSPYPKEALREGCLALYEKEKALGTELPAIVGAIQEFVEREVERLRLEHEAEWRRQVEESRLKLEQRFLSGADCKWTPVGKSADLYCRTNGRAYRLSPTKDKRWKLLRIASVEDQEGKAIGVYQYRRDANKALAEAAFQPEPRW
jgi:hypothetical protein